MKKTAKKTARKAAKKVVAKVKKSKSKPKAKEAAKKSAKAKAKPVRASTKKPSAPVTPKAKAIARQKASALSVKTKSQKKKPSPSSVEQAIQDFPGYPLYPSSEDIYNQGKKEDDIDPENTRKKKGSAILDADGEMNEKNFNDDVSGDDLDIPGSELDDEQEKVGSEDEENNYYSLGGDNHNDLEEDRG